jgi:hypothetical protein
MQPERKDDDDIPVGSCHNDCPSFESTLRKGQRFLLEDDIFGDRVGCERHPGWNQATNQSVSCDAQTSRIDIWGP